MKALLAILLLPGALYAGFECPRPASPGDIAAETGADCPWAGAARLMGGTVTARGLDEAFKAYAPGIVKQLAADKENKAALKLWGQSINFDELANGEIVNPAILAWLGAKTGVPAPAGRIMHAGVEHTYGYLFSLLPTKFGFKRARWVRPDVELGLKLPLGTLGPRPSAGTLLANATCVAGGIALKDEPAALALLGQAAKACAPAAAAFVSTSTARQRLTETLRLPQGRMVELRTDFVPFAAAQNGNTHLLVYSVNDSAAGQARLVTAFPVNEGFVKGALNPENLGADKPVQTRYNAHVEGVTGSVKLTGTREVSVRAD